MQTNTMLDEAEALPDLDEYFGMSTVDIAHAIINWPEGSEDQYRAIMAIRARAPDIGHNRPPLVEQLRLDTEGLLAEVNALVDTTESAQVIDDVSAAKCNDLLRQAIDKDTAVNNDRQRRNQPYADAVAAINAHYNEMRAMLAAAQTGLRRMLTAWDDKKREAAAAARAAAIAEQQERERQAAEARRKADEAAKAGNVAGAVSADIQAASLQEQAVRAETRATAIRPEPIRSTLGTTSRTRKIVFTIDDEDKAFAWARATAGIKDNLLADLRARIDSYLRSRAVGVAAVERGVDIPGITAKIELGAIQSRR